MAKEQVATENAATKIMPLPTLLAQLNSPEGNSRDAGRLASSVKNNTSPAIPTASSNEERTGAIDTPALAISVTVIARQPSGASGKGGDLASELWLTRADRPASTIR